MEIGGQRSDLVRARIGGGEGDLEVLALDPGPAVSAFREQAVSASRVLLAIPVPPCEVGEDVDAFPDGIGW